MVRRNKTYIYAIYNLTKGKYLGSSPEPGRKLEVKTYSGERAVRTAFRRLQRKVPQFELEIRLYKDDSQN